MYHRDWSITQNILLSLNNSDFIERCKITLGIMQMENYDDICTAIDRVEKTGFVKKKERFAVSFGNGNAYVYLWKHMNGNVFYVGSGTGNRCEFIGRGYNFARELDDADSVIYIVADGLNRDEAYKIERYVSGTISLLNPLFLKNKDNIIKNCDVNKFIEESKESLSCFDGGDIRSLENAVVNILIDNDFTYMDAITTQEFFDENGRKFFSSRYCTNGRYNQTFDPS